jgi:hypothetical protein
LLLKFLSVFTTKADDYRSEGALRWGVQKGSRTLINLRNVAPSHVSRFEYYITWNMFWPWGPLFCFRSFSYSLFLNLKSCGEDAICTR